MIDLEEQLKNPVWYSLKETHKKFIIEHNGVQFYNPEVCTFGSFFDETKTTEASNEYIKTSDDFFFVSENQTPIIDDSKVFLEKKIEGCQMVLNTLADIEIREEIVLLDANNGNLYYRLSESLFHTVVPLSDYIVFHEVTNGPFKKEDMFLPEWAPKKGDKSISRFQDGLNNAISDLTQSQN